MKVYRNGVGGSFVVAVFLTVLTGVLTAAEWYAGDRVVTTREAVVGVGGRELATVPTGIMLRVKDVNGDWVWVDVQRGGKTITGWIHVGNLASIEGVTARLKTISESREAGDLAEIGRLLRAGADVNVRNKFGVTPLMGASQEGHSEVVKLLLTAGTDVHAGVSEAGKDYTPLSVAKKAGHTEAVELLKKHGAKQ